MKSSVFHFCILLLYVDQKLDKVSTLGRLVLYLIFFLKQIVTFSFSLFWWPENEEGAKGWSGNWNNWWLNGWVVAGLCDSSHFLSVCDIIRSFPFNSLNEEKRVLYLPGYWDEVIGNLYASVQGTAYTQSVSNKSKKKK